MGGGGLPREHSGSLCRPQAGRYAIAMSRSNRIANAMSLRKSDLHLLVLGIAAIVFFAIGAGRAFRASYDFVPVYTGRDACSIGATPTILSSCSNSSLREAAAPRNCHRGRSICPSTRLQLSWCFPLWLCSGFRSPGCSGSCSTAAYSSLPRDLFCPLCTGPQRWLATALASFILATSGILLVLGRPGTFSISLVIIGCLSLRSWPLRASRGLPVYA